MLSETAMWWVAGLLTLGCALLLRYAFFGRRIGETPFCRKCRYNLTGVTIDDAGARCPECGVSLTRSKPRRGERPKRRVAKVAFAFSTLLLLGLVGFEASIRSGKIKLIEHLPESWLLSRVEAGGNAAIAALAELHRRETVATIDPKTIARLISRGLEVQAMPQLPLEGPGLIIDLSNRLSIGQLSAAQQQQYWQQAAHPVALTARPKLIAGETFMLRAEVELRIRTVMSIAGGLVTIECDGAQLEQVPFGPGKVTFVPSTAACGFSHIHETVCFVPATLGRHIIRTRHPFALGALPGSPTIGTERMFHAELQCEVEIVTERQDEMIILTRSPKSDEALRQTLGVSYFERPQPSDQPGPAAPGGESISLTIRGASRSPVNMHLLAFGERGGELYRLPAALTLDGGRTGPPRSQRFEMQVPTRFDRVFLVADPRTAYDLTLFNEMWGGVLVFDTLEDPRPATHVPGGYTTIYSLPRVEPAWPIEKILEPPLLDLRTTRAPSTPLDEVR